MMERKCNECANKLERGCKKWSCEFEPKYADPKEDAGTLAEQKVVHCNFTAEEIAKDFIEDVKAVESVLPDTDTDTDTDILETTTSTDCVMDYKDPETGVHYLIYKDKCGYSGMGGMTVRYNADGTIMVD